MVPTVPRYLGRAGGHTPGDWGCDGRVPLYRVDLVVGVGWGIVSLNEDACSHASSRQLHVDYNYNLHCTLQKT
jgi:hypothetical protein